ncbi:MAG: hypothetical protein IIT36_05200 [Aeriscardovia sp.]|nr:hypothetical protein [Aeriscardovia sp.]
MTGSRQNAVAIAVVRRTTQRRRLSVTLPDSMEVARVLSANRLPPPSSMRWHTGFDYRKNRVH